MKWKSTRLLLLAALGVGTLTVPLAAPAANATTIVQSATGSGQFYFTSDAGVTALRTFSFEARKLSDGTVRGEAQVNNRATGQTLNIHIDCLNVIGNIAVVSGIAWSATGPGNTDGDDQIFVVKDNGQGANAGPDEVTYSFGGTGLVCSGLTPETVDSAVTPFLYKVEAGNIQIR